MKDIGELLDAAKAAQNLSTDMALASALGVGRAAVSNWRKGRNLPDPVQCAALAGYTGVPLAKVLGIVGEARAISREEKAVWRKLAATAALVAIVLFPALTPAGASSHRFDVGANQAPERYIMRNLRWWAGLVWLWLGTRFARPSGPSIEARTV